LLKHLDAFHRFGLPLLLGCSRKSVIGNTLDLPADDRLEGTLVTTTLAVMARYGIVRVHDVKENKRTVAMAEAIRDVKG
ncbi:MAG: dihydropteroate synthase, partial [Lachnospiraceae bacterium]|nr:dihydropteroate synthase [Lachnospiraceae bacterium]